MGRNPRIASTVHSPGYGAAHERFNLTSRAKIEITFDEQLTGAFDDYGKRIEKWRLGELNELRNSFVAKAAACRALAGGSMSQSSADDSEEGAQGIADDLKALESFNR